MDKAQAQILIKNTFENAFDKVRFSIFIKNMLTQIEMAPFVYKGNYIRDAFDEYISTLERVGKYSDGEHEIDLLIVRLKRETSLERARTMQRNFVAWYLKGSRGGKLKDAALVAFVAPNSEDWRFSLVKMDYRFEEIKSGKVKVKEEFTPARRWSFLVGKNEASHTAQSKLVPILMDDESPSLTQLEEAFNVEKVGKEFFEKYRDLFIWTKAELDKIVKANLDVKQDFESNSVDTVNFAKKLLGQIVFLYFLQKKGWFGVNRDANWGTGSKQYLRELFNKQHCAYDNLFNDILEPLFYEALRNDRSHDDDYYSRFNSKIPFLNGGLFDPIGNYDWVHTDIQLPNDLFSNRKRTKAGDIGTGILDIFDRYNFTVKEDEPLDKEVAIDPEMLGKAYEKFNAIRPDNYDEYIKALKSGKKGAEGKYNKQYGVYYTPREIVHYMCQQSLIQYLHSELSSVVAGNEAMKESSVPTKEDIDFFVEHGEHFRGNEARVVGKGRETDAYPYRLPENIRKNAKLIDDKLADIRVCDPAVGSGAFPVSMMTEIVKARNVLSTFLSSRGAIATTQDRTVYDFKRECIEKSLYGVDIDPGAVEIAKLRLWLSLVVDEEDIKKIKPLPNLDYKIVCGNSLLGVEKNLFNIEYFNDLERLKPLYFNETNPSKKQVYKRQIDNLISQITNGHTEFDSEVYFSEVFHKKGGFDIMIANPPYVTIGGKECASTSRLLKEAYTAQFTSYEYKTNLFVLFIERSISLVGEGDVVVFILPRTLLDNYHMTKIRRMILGKMKILTLLELRGNVFENAVIGGNLVIVLHKCQFQNHRISNLVSVASIETLDFEDISFSQIFQSNYLDSFQSRFFISTNTAQYLFSKIAQNKKLLGNICEIKNGVNTGNSAKILLTDTRKGNKYRPILEGKDVNRYSVEWGGLWINYDPGLKNRIDISKLDTRQAKIDFALREERIFNAEKVIIRQTADKLIAAIDSDRFITRHSTHLILPKNQSISLKYILALLNSRLLNHYYSLMVPEKGKVFAEVKIVNLQKLPIVLASSSKQKIIIDIVDHILAVKRADPTLDTRKMEGEIDQLVYKLYELTNEEICTIEEVD